MKKIAKLCSSAALLAMAGISGNASAIGLEGTAYVIDGDDNDNRVVVFGRFGNGALRNFGSVSTGGGGFGSNADFDPTGGQDSLVMSEDGRFLYATNPGSGEISVFFLTSFGRPILIQRVSSGGIFPASIAMDGDILYVINGGGDGALVAFERNQDNGTIEEIQGGTQTFNFGFDGLPMGFDRNFAPGDLAFDTVKRRLMMVYAGGGEIVSTADLTNLPPPVAAAVPEAPTGQIYTWELDNDGLVVGAPEIRDADGILPFAIEFTENGWGLVVSAVTGSLASYEFTGVGAELASVSGRVDTGIFESCWIEVTSSRFGYVTNPFEGTLSSFFISRDGNVELVQQTAASPGLPTDMAIDSDESHLYVLVIPTGQVQSYEINHDTGAITFAGAAGGLPIFANDGFSPHGLVVR
jgi:DNA-binding beta-propeller fold protein YncE